ncbi:hypothetical protein POM88_052543 [Heracleum sosnowskyi]|uniref:Transmembrane protein n=1 Tax=Heracleum sosnowskyi TaxID=360622 RepID=A0AAD8GRT8_9APIA|nr:hypothetical protein POM88_052543 [Heracleum sosnowskyi]
MSNCSTQFNVAFINITPLQGRENGNHSIVGIFGIAVSVLLTALQLKYQSETDSPFQDHPKAMVIAIASLLIFCLGCDVEQYFGFTYRSSTLATLLHHVLRLLGFVSLASLAYVIFSTSTSSAPSIIVFLIFPWFFIARFVLHWVQNRNLHGSRGASNFRNLNQHFALKYIDTLPRYHVVSANLV